MIQSIVEQLDVTVLLKGGNCSPHIIRQTINVSSIGRRLDTKLHEQMKICVNSMLCLMARPQIHLPNVKTCLDVVNTYFRSVKGRGAAVYRFRTCVRTIPCAPAGACLCFSVEVLLDIKF